MEGRRWKLWRAKQEQVGAVGITGVCEIVM